MKKLGCVFFALLICLAMALPASAGKTKVYGRITTDAYYYDSSEDTKYGAGGDGMQSLEINMPQGYNRLGLKYKSDDGKVAGRLEFREGATKNHNHRKTDVIMNYAYIDYRPTKKLWFRFGRQSTSISILAPKLDYLGSTLDHGEFKKIGNFHGGSSKDGLKLYYDFTENMRLEFMVIDPNNDNGENAWDGYMDSLENLGAPVWDPAVGDNFQFREENVLPRFDIALNMQFGNFWIEPAFSWLRQEIEYWGEIGNTVVAGGIPIKGEEEIDIWAASLGAKLALGRVTFAGEITIGENLGDGNYSGASGGAKSRFNFDLAKFAASLGSDFGDIADSDYLGAWITADIKFNKKVSLVLGASMEDTETDKTNHEQTIYGFSASLPIKVAKGLTVRPEINYVDFDDDAKNAGVKDDKGDELIVGVQFQLKF